MEENKKEIIEETQSAVGTGLEIKEKEVISHESVSTEVTTTEVKQKVSELLVSKFIKNDDIKEFLNKLTFKLDDKVLSILKLILDKSPDVLDKITDNIKDILKDGNIDQKDIPLLFKLVANLYKTDFKNIVSRMSLNTKEIVLFIKSLILLLIDLDIIKVSNKKETSDIIDVSAELLEFVIPIEKENTNCCFSLFWKHV
jgi:hypothetical protein